MTTDDRLQLFPAWESWPEMVEFDSLINIRPRQNNRSRDVEDAELRDRILKLIEETVQR